MYKRHFIFALMCLLSLATGFQHVSAQSQLAQDTYAIFEASCLNCHGTDGAFRETLLMEHSELINGGSVLPGNPNDSELYKRLLGPTENGAQMPFGLPQLPAQSIETVRRWILAGAPAWTTTRITDGRFISPAEILDTIETHLNTLSSFDRAFARYFTLTHLYNAGETAQILGEYRKALNKLVNSLSWGITVTNPQPIDSLDTIFYIDLRHYEWDRIDAWTKIEGVYPYHISFDAPTQTSLHDRLGRLQTQMKTEIPSVHVDWFIATASTPPLYHELLALPSTARELESQLDVDVVGNLQNAPGVRVWRAGFNNSGVSNHNRIVERHTSQHGAYWKSYDFAGSVGTQNILTHPLGFTHDGGEVIFNLPNGLQGYYLADGNGLRLDEAPISIVSNPAASDPTVRNGISCIGCHTEGMKTFEDQVRAAIESNSSPPYNKAQALRLYVEQSVMDDRVSEDMETYRVALEATGGTFSGVEPVSRFHEAFQAPVDAAYAAAVVGLETDTFLERVRENTGLQNVGLLALDNPNGSVKRDTWTSSFRDIISALDYPQRVGEPPVITQPDVLPGGQVHIPDPNLRAAAAEALGKNPNSPILATEMKGLRRIEANERDIRDLTGIQFANNLNELNISGNQISDISPVRGLTGLTYLAISDTEVTDISVLRGLTNLLKLAIANTEVTDISALRNLTNLVHLEIQSTAVSNLSPLAGLINLRTLHFSDINSSDLSPLAGLINLDHISFSNNSISDLSPLAGLVNLKIFRTWGNRFTDISILTRLNKLEAVDICGADLNQTSLVPLTNLPNLRELYLARNGIWDVSSLASLTGLTRLDLSRNEISDITPLAVLTNLTWLDLSRNELLSDISPLATLLNLEWLSLRNCNISDISAFHRLTNLAWMDVARNEISDVSPLSALSNLKFVSLKDNNISDIAALARLTNLTWLDVSQNEISDLSPLDKLRSNFEFLGFSDNPYFPPGGPKIVGPWLWLLLPGAKLPSGKDLLSEASGGALTELTVAAHGATVGQSVGDSTWTLDTLPHQGAYNISHMLQDSLRNGTIYGSLSLYSPQEQQTMLYAGSQNSVKVWLNGELVHQIIDWRDPHDYTDAVPVTLKPGRNVLLVACAILADNGHGFFGFSPGTEYTVGTGIGYGLSKTPIHIGDTFTLDVRAENVVDLAGWQFDIAFDPAVLQAVDVSEGDFLKTDGGATFFQSGSIDNDAGKITGLIAGRISEGGVSGSGSVLQVRFKAKSEGETELALENFLFGSAAKESIPAGPLEIHFTVEEQLLTGDINRDGVVNILDLISVAQQLGKRVSADSPEDINGDGVVNIFDLTLVAQGIGGAAAPAVATGRADAATVKAWIAEAHLADDGSIAFRQGIANLQNLLTSLIIPQETALLANYPNPFNPETWIPYQLAAPSEVALTIYDMNGGIVRRLEVGHQAAGIYQRRNRALYWDGRNDHGEFVASGLYFYTLRAGEFAVTRKMLIRK